MTAEPAQPGRILAQSDWRVARVDAGRTADRAIAVFVLALFAAALFWLISPGRTFVAIFANDVMVFFDGAHRLLSGQVPNRDFHTPLGPLAYLMPALGLQLGGSLGAMMPVATAGFAALLAPVLAYVAASRLPTPAALLVSLYMVLLTVAPVNPGDPWTSIGFAMFYNRFGWAALSCLFLLILPPRPGGVGRTTLDAACVALVLLSLFYLKISFAAVGAAFALALLAFAPTRRFAALGLAATLAGVLVVELFWRSTGAYLADIGAAASVSGAVRGGAFKLFMATTENARQGVVYLGLLALGLARGARPVQLAASLGMALAGLLLLNQSAQMTEIVTLLPAALVALPGSPAVDGRPRPALDLPALLLLAALALPGAANAALALHSFHQHALLRKIPVDGAPADLDGLVTIEGPTGPDGPISREAMAATYRAGVTTTGTFNVFRRARSWQPLAQSEYLWTLEDGAALLRRDPRLTGTVFALDICNPFNALLGRRPPRGDNSWNHYRRTFNERDYLPPEVALADARVLMEPKNPMEVYSAVLLKREYQTYVRRHFAPVAESTYWRAWVRVPTKDKP
jgi:hypothetical protein